MKTKSERRKMKRWKVAVLVRCSIPKFANEVFELEMWAKDVNQNGLQLEWARGLGVSHVQKDGDSAATKSIRFEDVQFVKGSKILVQDLFYDDEGSPFLEGRISWVKRSGETGNWGLGIEFEKGEKHSQTLMGAFKDFLGIVKNPTAAIRGASLPEPSPRKSRKK